MQVSKLREILSAYPKDTVVVIKGYEGGVDKVSYVAKTTILERKSEEWYFGKYEETTDPNGRTAILIK